MNQARSHTVAVDEPYAKLRQIRERIAQTACQIGIASDDIRIVGASKRQTVTAIRAFAAAGLRSCGENYLQEAISKQDALSDLDLEWHFIGHIQTNKAKQVAERFAWVQTIDSLRIAQRLSDARLKHNPQQPLECCIQVNVDDEPQKAGVDRATFDALVAGVGKLPGLRLRGVMAIPTPHPCLEQRIASFRRVKALFDWASPLRTEYWDTISMGMSDDYLTAVRCGANVVRLGTALFGPRPPQ